MPISRRTLLIAALAVPPAAAAAQPATPVDLAATMADHVAWVVSLFDGGAAGLTVADIEARFDENFRSVVPPEELIATIQQLAGQFGPIELVEDQSTQPGEFVGIFRTRSGDGVMISIAVDPKTGLIAGFFITPAALTAASPAASPAATPVAAAPVELDVAEQVARYEDTVETIRAVGEPAVAAVLAGDDEALAPMLSPQVARAMGPLKIADVIASYTTRQVEMTFAEAGMDLFGQWNDDAITGVMVQAGTPYPFALAAAEPQTGELPAGRWSGELRGLGTGIEVTFGTGSSGELTATLDVPEQGIANAALSNVRYRADKPVGELVEDRAFAPGGASDSYTADHAWGDARLRITIGVETGTQRVTTLLVFPAVPVPPDAGAPEPAGTYRLPFDGTWWVFWGGETELRNYHVIAPSQRYAYDLVIWKDGATWRGGGSFNADYWAWGQPVLAPVAGEVVHAVDGQEDLRPNTNLAQPGGVTEPAGNHVVIEVAEGEYAIIAHLQQGSVRVRKGDRVAAGDLLGIVGNSGNSSEPHVHIHVQTTPLVTDPAAEGIPLRFDDILVDGEPAHDAVPVQGSFIANP